MTPSFPTFSMTSAMRLPISSSCEERTATFAICEELSTGVDCDLMEPRMVAMAFSIPRLMAIGSAPAATFLKPSATMAWAKTVDVVVPSPASSLVFLDASFKSWAPMFSNGSSRSTSLAIVTPSELTCGGPNFLSTMTFWPRGPSVFLTVLARMSMPSLSLARASSSNSKSLAGICLVTPFWFWTGDEIRNLYCVVG